MSFIRGTEYANKLNSWHNNLEEDRQQRASLRRCSSLLDVYTSSGFRDLLFKLKPLWEGKAAWRFTALAIIAGVVSHVSENDPPPLICRTDGSEEWRSTRNERAAFSPTISSQNRRGVV